MEINRYTSNRIMTDDHNDEAWANLIKGIKKLNQKKLILPELPKEKKSWENKSVSNFSIMHWQPSNKDEEKANFIERNTLRKIKKSKIPIEAVLDLHGYTQDAAYIKFINFIHQAYSNKMKVLLVITGKGSINKTSIIKRLLEEWVTHSPAANKILSYTTADPKHGGSGAFYIILKKRNDLL